jgi:hypothetical protein
MQEKYSELRKSFPELKHNVYRRPEVRLEIAEGRSFVRRSDEKYQIIQMTLVDTWASTAAGAFALSESNLYTTEAFADYLSHLTPDGVLAFTRWGFDPPRESLRLISLAIEALNKMGEREPWKHVIVGREGSVEGWGARDTVLISRKPFTDADIQNAREVMRESKMEAVYVPGDEPRNPFGQLLLSKNPETFYAHYAFDISPVSDNRPFFFYTVQPRDIWNYLSSASTDSADFKINRAVPRLFGLLAIAVAATLVILALPPVVLGTRLPRERSVQLFLLYFLFIGTGYILIEVALIQKFVLFLGHPTYALTVVVFSMLVFSGLGSSFSKKIAGRSDGKLSVLLIVVAGLVSLLGAVATPLLAGGVGLPLWVKVVVAILMLAPAAFFMGMPFPLGLARLTEKHEPSVRWAWSLNAAASVLGSVLAIAFAIYTGLMQTLVLGAILYILAFAALRATASWRTAS